MKPVSICLLFVMLVMQVAVARAGVQLGATRVIFKEGQREDSLMVRDRSSDSSSHLIQSWVTDAAGGETAHMIVVPPLFRLEPGGGRALRIIRTEGELPSQQESLFWLNVKIIPSSEKKLKNVLQAVVIFQLKAIYRPSGLKGNANEAYKSLKFTRDGTGRLQVSNPTPYYVSFASLKVDGVEVKEAEFLAPNETASYPISSSSVKKIIWKAVDDYGAHTPEATFTF